MNLRVGLGPRAALYAVQSSGPQVCGDVVMAGAQMTDRPPVKEQPPGDVQAFDVRTGKPRWTFHVIPREGEFGNDTWENESWTYYRQGESLVADQRRRGTGARVFSAVESDQ